MANFLKINVMMEILKMVMDVLLRVKNKGDTSVLMEIKLINQNVYIQ